MDFRHLIVTCLFSKLRLPFDNQKVKENYAIFCTKHRLLLLMFFQDICTNLFFVQLVYERLSAPHIIFSRSVLKKE